MTSREGFSAPFGINDEDTMEDLSFNGFSFNGFSFNGLRLAYEERDRSRRLLQRGQAFKNGQLQYTYGIIEAAGSVENVRENLGKLVSYFNKDDLISRNHVEKKVWMNEALRNSQKNSVLFYPDSSVERYSNLVFDDPAFEDLTGFDKVTIEEKFRAPCEIIWNVVGKHSYYDESKDQSVISQLEALRLSTKP